MRDPEREEWSIENYAALAERCSLLESEGGTAAERHFKETQKKPAEGEKKCEILNELMPF